MKTTILLLAVFCIVGCAEQLRVGELPPANDDFLSDTARQELQLPARDVPVRSNDADAKYVATLTPEVQKTLDDFFRASEVKPRISAARRVGAYLLLWASFWPTSARDIGPACLIYSVEKKKVVGYFCSGAILG